MSEKFDYLLICSNKVQNLTTRNTFIRLHIIPRLLLYYFNNIAYNSTRKKFIAYQGFPRLTSAVFFLCVTKRFC